jgi:hypothetical protein
MTPEADKLVDEWVETLGYQRILKEHDLADLKRRFSEAMGEWVQIGWYWQDGVSTDKYTCRFQGYRKEDIAWFVKHKWAPIFVKSSPPPMESKEDQES